MIGVAIFRGTNQGKSLEDQRELKEKIQEMILKLKKKEFQGYFDFIYSQLGAMPHKLTPISEREKEHIYHSRFCLINRTLAFSAPILVIVEDHVAQANGNLNL